MDLRTEYRSSVQNSTGRTALCVDFGTTCDLGGAGTALVFPWLALVCLPRAVWAEPRPEWADGSLTWYASVSPPGKSLVKTPRLPPGHHLPTHGNRGLTAFQRKAVGERRRGIQKPQSSHRDSCLSPCVPITHTHWSQGSPKEQELALNETACA